jgi:hypothetical protein
MRLDQEVRPEASGIDRLAAGQGPEPVDGLRGDQRERQRVEGAAVELHRPHAGAQLGSQRRVGHVELGPGGRRHQDG